MFDDLGDRPFFTVGQSGRLLVGNLPNRFQTPLADPVIGRENFFDGLVVHNVWFVVRGSLFFLVFGLWFLVLQIATYKLRQRTTNNEQLTKTKDLLSLSIYIAEGDGLRA
jgi:hypothetical protein